MAKYTKIIAFLFPLVFVGLMVYLTINHRAFYYSGSFTGEGGLIEDATSIVYLLATLIGALIILQLIRCNLTAFGCIYLGLSVGLFFIAGEELSWGQRGFHWSTPEMLMKWNNQGETNLHNILNRSALGALYIAAGLYGAFSRLLAPTNLKTQYRLATDLVTPDWFLGLYFFPAFGGGLGRCLAVNPGMRLKILWSQGTRKLSSYCWAWDFWRSLWLMDTAYMQTSPAPK